MYDVTNHHQDQEPRLWMKNGTQFFFFLPSRTYAHTFSTTKFALRSVQTHISKQIRIEICVCTLFNANPVVDRVGAHALKGKINFPMKNEQLEYSIPRSLLSVSHYRFAIAPIQSLHVASLKKTFSFQQQ